MSWKELRDKPIVDKHSTGGVGDKVSLMLAPMLAACGAYVPMIAGRGLGHTGGTLDKLDSLSGYNTGVDIATFKKTVKEAGCAIIGQTADLAPADKKLYAIRDVCATVESIPLITASILSKKLAAGLQYLVMDIKCGNGAFMENMQRASDLAYSIVEAANGAGTKTSAILTDMDSVLGTTVGNALELGEALAYLKGEKPDARLNEVTMALCSELLINSGLAKDALEAEIKLRHSISSGTAYEHFVKMASLLGADTRVLENYDLLQPKAPYIEPGISGNVRICFRRQYQRSRAGGDYAWRRPNPPGTADKLYDRLYFVLPDWRQGQSQNSFVLCSCRRQSRNCRSCCACPPCRNHSAGKTGKPSRLSYAKLHSSYFCAVRAETCE